MTEAENSRAIGNSSTGSDGDAPIIKMNGVNNNNNEENETEDKQGDTYCQESYDSLEEKLSESSSSSSRDDEWRDEPLQVDTNNNSNDRPAGRRRKTSSWVFQKLSKQQRQPQKSQEQLVEGNKSNQDDGEQQREQKQRQKGDVESQNYFTNRRKGGENKHKNRNSDDDDSFVDLNEVMALRGIKGRPRVVHKQQYHQEHQRFATSTTPGNLDSSRHEQPLSLEDIEMCKELEREYEMALEEREIGYTARYDSVRQSACFSVGFMIMIMLFGTIFFVKQAAFNVNDALLFSLYTITTVGYGNVNIPTTPGFQLYTIFYIFVGIATMTIMVAQVYQCVALEASRAQHSRDKSLLARRGLVRLGSRASSETTESISNETYTCWDHILQFIENSKMFFQTNEVGRGLSVLFPFAGLIFVGAVVVGPIEGWSFIESVYFAVVSLTTVGYGDYQPTQPASTWFAIFWLPCSIGFMSMFLGNVASFYIRLSDRNINRIEMHMRRRIELAKQKAQKEHQEARERAYAGQHHRHEKAHEEELHKADKTDHRESQDDDHIDKNKQAMKTAAVNNDKQEYAGGTTRATENTSTSSKTSPRKLKVSGRHRRLANQNSSFHVVPMNEQEVNSTMSSLSTYRGIQRGASHAPSFSSSHTFNNETRRQRIKRMSRSFTKRNSVRRDSNSSQSSDSHTESTLESSYQGGQTMETMKDIIMRVRHSRKHAQHGTKVFSNSSSGRRNNDGNDQFHADVGLNGTEFFKKRNSVFSLPLTSSSRKTMRKASFAVRVLVQERFAEIIAHDIAGFQSAIEIQENTLTVTIDTMRQTADKWCIPRRARKAFRAVAFEALYFVGEHGLITNGADALFDLTPIEFHSLFSPLVAAMGDAETMEGWLDATKVLAEVDFHEDNDENDDDHGEDQNVIVINDGNEHSSNIDSMEHSMHDSASAEKGSINNSK